MEHQVKRSIGPVALLLTGLGSIVGSGWLFGAWRAAKIAGPAAVLAWVIGAVIIMAIAMTYVELTAMFPESGGVVRFARYSHGSLVGFISAWANWISIVAVISIEAIASVQYMASWPYPWARDFYADGVLTTQGLAASTALVVVYFLLNFWGVKLFVKSTSAITTFKLIVPTITVIALVWSGFHGENFALGSAQEFAPYGWSAVFTAVSTSGIVFSFNGFQSPASLAGEVRNPARSIPFAVITSVLISLVLYVCLQVAFIGAVSPDSIVHGWKGLDFRSPFAQLAIAVNLNWLAILLYLDAFVSPSGTAVINMATTARMIFAMERNNTMPKVFGKLHPVHNIPRNAMWLNLGVAFLFLYFFRGWGALAGAISVATIIAYLTGPVSLLALHRHAPDQPRPVQIPGIRLIAPFAFVCASLLLYWARWPLTGRLILLVVAALPIYFYYQAKVGWKGFRREMKSALWLVCYLPALALISLVGSTKFGGLGLLDGGLDYLVVILGALIFYAWGVSSGRRTTYLQESGTFGLRAPTSSATRAEPRSLARPQAEAS